MAGCHYGGKIVRSRHYLKCSGKLSSCFCHRQQVITENCTEIKIAILLLKYDSERNAIHTDRACLRYLTERFDRDLLSNSFKFPFMVWKTWMKHSYCYIDLFITLLLGNAINSSINSVEGYFLPFVTPKFMLRYPEMETDPVISALSTSHKTLWFNHLINYTSRLCGVILQQQQGKMLHGEHRMNFVQQSQSFLLPFPPWIAMIFFCAILAVPLIICAEKLFSATRRCHPRSSSEPMPIHLRHRWRAGFAGGMLAENMRHKKESKALVAKSARSHSAAFHVQAGKPPFSNPAL
ncbi:unnamed protein product [Soboliphyme baturini]|uniref:Innexin n=1 Tax=Soboliphyme baturini TaxID=241478 RepID=A0A183J281_9BILA|nr:unnamed protein product [Soboliphyme baturini]